MPDDSGKYITHEQAMREADAWGRVRLSLKLHEMTIRSGAGSAAEFNSRNELLQEISRYASPHLAVWKPQEVGWTSQAALTELVDLVESIISDGKLRDETDRKAREIIARLRPES